MKACRNPVLDGNPSGFSGHSGRKWLSSCGNPGEGGVCNSPHVSQDLHHHPKLLWLHGTTPITMIIELLHWRGQQLVLYTALTHLQQPNNACDALCGLAPHGTPSSPTLLYKVDSGSGYSLNFLTETPAWETRTPHLLCPTLNTGKMGLQLHLQTWRQQVDKQTQISECSSKPPRPRNNWWVKKNKLKRLTPAPHPPRCCGESQLPRRQML